MDCVAQPRCHTDRVARWERSVAAAARPAAGPQAIPSRKMCGRFSACLAKGDNAGVVQVPKNGGLARDACAPVRLVVTQAAHLERDQSPALGLAGLVNAEPASAAHASGCRM